MTMIIDGSNPIPTGWICPNCKGIFAPFVKQCLTCGTAKPKVETVVTRPTKTLITE